MRGEDECPHFQTGCASETPPRAWGRPQAVVSSRPFSRNTPTCVGKTHCRYFLAAAEQKHPHVRGEDCCIKKGNFYRLETPPRAWGRHESANTYCINAETPPRAWGRLSIDWLHVIPCQKHPHVRGEDLPKIDPPKENSETPPRAWGRRYDVSTCARGFGNTPTCVGKTM